MPELPDVETFRRRAEAAVGQRVDRASLRKPGHVLESVSGSTVRRRLRGRRITGTDRQGKLLLVELDHGEDHLVLHFGMTGFLVHGRGLEQALDHPRLLLELEDGTCLGFDCTRQLGGIGMARDLAEELEARSLGPDALALSPACFLARLRSHRGMVKSGLMNQALVSGLGNVYADEVLFQARIHPRASTADLDDPTLERLHRKMRYVLERAVDAGARLKDLPRGWLIHRRAPGANCSRCHGPIEPIEVAGRRGFHCPSCQRPAP